MNSGLCACGCGQKTTIPKISNTRDGRIAGVPVKWRTGHDKKTHRLSKTPEYHIWSSAKKRCTNPKDGRWYCYGARGIQCNLTFEEFFAIVGPRPSPEYTIDRINNDGNYEAGNLRWATRSENIRNRRKFPSPPHDKLGRWMSKLSSEASCQT
jgi:hypothetical protein